MASKTRSQRRWEKKKRAIERGDLEVKPRNMEVLGMIQMCRAHTFADKRKVEASRACRKKFRDDD